MNTEIRMLSITEELSVKKERVFLRILLIPGTPLYLKNLRRICEVQRLKKFRLNFPVRTFA